MFAISYLGLLVAELGYYRTPFILQFNILNPLLTMAEHAATLILTGYLYVRFAGRVAEYDTPARLLEDKSSMFLKLVSEYSTRSSGVPDF